MDAVVDREQETKAGPDTPKRCYLCSLPVEAKDAAKGYGPLVHQRCADQASREG